MARLVTSTYRDDGTVRLALEGELDLSTVRVVDEQLGALEEEAPDRLVVDLRGLSFMDSTGLRTLVAADARARDAGRRMVIVRGPDIVARVFRITGLDAHLELVDEPSA